METSFQSASTRARLVIVFLVIWMAAAIGLVVVNLLRLDLVNRVASGQPVTLDQAKASDSLVGGVALASAGVYVLAGIFVLIWLFGVVRNSQILGERYLRYSPGFAVGCWFIPFANLVLPYLAVREEWGASDPELLWSTPDTRRRSRGGWLVLVWWLMFVAGSLIGAATLGFGSNSDSDPITRVRAITYITVVQEALHLAAALLLIAVVTRLTSRQDQKAHAVLAAVLANPAPGGYATPAPPGQGFIPASVPQPPAMPPPPPPPPQADFWER